jgi:hypothetical protein
VDHDSLRKLSDGCLDFSKTLITKNIRKINIFTHFICMMFFLLEMMAFCTLISEKYKYKHGAEQGLPKGEY